MDNRVNAWLEDILRSIDEIFEFLPEKRDFFEFQKDLKTKKAVERNIEIIGEAVNRIMNYKNHVEGHFRTTKTGKTVYVKPYTRSRSKN